MTLTNNTYLTVFILAIAAFTLAGLAVVPAIELANAIRIYNYCKIARRRIPIRKMGNVQSVDEMTDSNTNS